jgi:hypothetical protein
MTSGALALLALLTVGSAVDRAWIPAFAFGAGWLALLGSALYESGCALGAVLGSLPTLAKSPA